MCTKNAIVESKVKVMSKVKVGIIGCGGMGRTHAENLQKIPQASIGGYADANQERARSLCSLHGGEYYTTDADKVINDPQTDAVFICTWHDSHPRLAIAAAERGKHVFIEKPLALTIEDCQTIKRAVESAGVKLAVGFQARFSPFVQKIREVIPNPVVTFGQMIDPKWGDAHWAQSSVTGGGNVLSQGCHTFDLLYYFNQSEPLSIHAEGGTFTHQETQVIDSVVATIRFENGSVGSALIGDFGPSPWTGKSFYELFDGKGKTATLYHYYDGVKFAGVEPSDYTKEDLPEETRNDPARCLGYLPEVEEFVDCIVNDTRPKIAAQAKDGVRATTLAIKAFESIRRGEIRQLH